MLDAWLPGFHCARANKGRTLFTNVSTTKTRNSNAMIDIAKLVSRIEDAVDDDLDETSQYTKALRILCSTARDYNRTYRELEYLRDSVGFNKPFRILDLPREIRDQIYTHSLQAESAVNTTSQRPVNVTDRDDPNKPPTPALLLANHQIASEAAGILYSKNVFRFEQPMDLFTFESMIGPECGRRVKQISISIRLPGKSNDDFNEELFALSDDISVDHWIQTLKICGFQQVRHLDIQMVQGDGMFLPPMPEDLQKSIIEFLGGREQIDETPYLSLLGFEEKASEGFPKWWKVVTDQSDAHKDAVKDLHKVLENCSPVVLDPSDTNIETVDD